MNGIYYRVGRKLIHWHSQEGDRITLLRESTLITIIMKTLHLVETNGRRTVIISHEGPWDDTCSCKQMDLDSSVTSMSCPGSAGGVIHIFFWNCYQKCHCSRQLIAREQQKKSNKVEESNIPFTVTERGICILNRKHWKRRFHCEIRIINVH